MFYEQKSRKDFLLTSSDIGKNLWLLALAVMILKKNAPIKGHFSIFFASDYFCLAVYWLCIYWIDISQGCSIQCLARCLLRSHLTILYPMVLHILQSFCFRVHFTQFALYHRYLLGLQRLSSLTIAFRCFKHCHITLMIMVSLRYKLYQRSEYPVHEPR